MKCHLIGVKSHGYQFRGYTKLDWMAFEKYLSFFCQGEQIDLVAEELNEEEIRKWSYDGAMDSVPRCVAAKLKIKHLFCDPDEATRKSLGIRSRQEIVESLGFSKKWLTAKENELICQKIREEWPKREAFWLDKLQKNNSTHCVFVLGAKHVESFEKLLTSKHFDIKIENENWEP